MPAPRFDLQSHSIHSDGVLPPAAVVQLAARAGVEIFALSDHDTVDGVDEALDAGAAAGVRVVPAVELSSVDEDREDLHVLGYGIDHRDPTLRAALASFRADRSTRAERMAAAFESLGLAVDHDALRRRRDADLPIGRPHLAEAVVRHPGNAHRLAEERLRSPSDVLVAYLVPGRPAYRGRERPTVEAAIARIHAAGGLAVWAHPFWDVDAADAVVATIERFAAARLDGVETFYVTHTEPQVRLIHETCTRLGLETTGSSDFHGPDHPLFNRVGAHELFGLTPRLDRIAALA